MSAVKNGDRVRMTLGENALVGMADRVDPYGLYLSLDACQVALYLNTDDWSTEVIAPPIPSEDGTIVRDHEGCPWIAGTNGWYRAGFSTPFTQTYMQKKYGPLTVLWTPEATS